MKKKLYNSNPNNVKYFMNFIYPDYNNSILNVSSELLRYLGKENGFAGIPQLATELKKDFKNVVLLVIDGLGMNILENHLPVKSFLWRNMAQRITSLFPATTTNCTASLTTASSPARHGRFAWALNFGDKTVELFRDTEYYTKEILPEGFTIKRLPVNNFWEQPGLRRDITCYSLFNEKIKDTSQRNIPFTDLQDMAQKLSGLCARSDKKFVYAYYSELDSKMHDCGASSRKVRKLVKQINKTAEDFVRENADTLLIITADHGHLDVKGFANIYADKEITRCLERPFSGDPRAAVFYVRRGMHAQFKTAFQKYENDFVLFKTSDLIDMNIFGKFDGSKNKEYLGDYIAVGTETNKLLVFQDGKQLHGKKYTYKGHHTGMTKSEMVLPLIIAGQTISAPLPTLQSPQSV